MEWFRERKSFSLVELMIVISILAILGAIIYLAVQFAINRAHRAKAANNLRTIALAHAQFISDFGRAITYSDLSEIKGGTINSPHDVNSLAAVLAKYGYIEDVSVWDWDFDYLIKEYKISNTLPAKIYDISRISSLKHSLA
jgi:prepilin-type N-terminal cleavage/methylation domain-containing protein